VLFRTVSPSSIRGVNLDQNRVASSIESVAAPRPVPRIRDESPLKRVRVHIRELLNRLFTAPDIEIVESPLPELRQAVAGRRERQSRNRKGLESQST